MRGGGWERGFRVAIGKGGQGDTRTEEVINRVNLLAIKHPADDICDAFGGKLPLFFFFVIWPYIRKQNRRPRDNEIIAVFEAAKWGHSDKPDGIGVGRSERGSQTCVAVAVPSACTFGGLIFFLC